MNTSDELCSTAEAIERIKDVLSNYITNNKVYDWHVADAIGIKVQSLAIKKRRNKMPYEEIILFCKRYDIDPMSILIKK